MSKFLRENFFLSKDFALIYAKNRVENLKRQRAKIDATSIAIIVTYINIKIESYLNALHVASCKDCYKVILMLFDKEIDFITLNKYHDKTLLTI